MRKPDRVEAGLARLDDVRKSRDTAALSKFLDDRVNLVVAKAAAIAGELRAIELASKLDETFARLIQNAGTLDKGCAALTAIARALYAMDYDDSTTFLAGIRHVQKEPVWGGSVDTAIELRSTCALGLVQTRYEGTMFELVRLLADPEWKARLAAARALGCTNDSGASLALQLKASVGDEEPEVSGECLAGLLTQNPERYKAFVSGFLDLGGGIAEAAILALGTVRTEAAADLLIERWTKAATRTTRQSLIDALATNRSERTLEFLLSRIANPHEEEADAIAQALEKYRPNEAVRESVRSAMALRKAQTAPPGNP